MLIFTRTEGAGTPLMLGKKRWLTRPSIHHQIKKKLLTTRNGCQVIVAEVFFLIMFLRLLEFMVLPTTFLTTTPTFSTCSDWFTRTSHRILKILFLTLMVIFQHLKEPKRESIIFGVHSPSYVIIDNSKTYWSCG